MCGGDVLERVERRQGSLHCRVVDFVPFVAARAHVSWIASFFAQLAGQRFADYFPSDPRLRWKSTARLMFRYLRRDVRCFRGELGQWWARSPGAPFLTLRRAGLRFFDGAIG